MEVDTNLLLLNSDFLSLKEKPLDPDEWMQRRYEAMTRNAFSDIANWKPDNPKLQVLSQYAQGVEDKFRFLRSEVGMPVGKAELLMSKIPPEDRRAGFDSVILKLQRDTDYLKELEDVGISAALLNGLENGKYGAYTLFLAPDTIFAKRMRAKNTAAAYNPPLDTVFIPHKIPSEEEMWLMLVTEGKLPKVVSYIDHELTHDTQWSPQQRTAVWALTIAPSVAYFTALQKYGFLPAMGIQVALSHITRKAREGLDTDAMLREIHAYNAAASSPTFEDKNFDEKDEIVAHVINAYEPPGKDIFDALRAYDNIHTLRILGLNDKDLGAIVRNARFDKKTRTFPLLDSKIAEKKQEWGIEDEYTFYFVTQALTAQHDLELKVQRHKAQQIATRELERETGRW